MRKKLKQLMGVLLSLALVLGLMPGMSLTALAAYDGNPYASLVETTDTVTFNGIDWYIIADESTAVNAGTVTLLAKAPISASKFYDSSNVYSKSTVKGVLTALTDEGGSFAGVANAIETIYLKDGSGTIENVQTADTEGAYGVKLYLLSTTEVNSTYNLSNDVKICSQNGGDANVWWLRSPGNRDDLAACVNGVNGDVADSGSPVSREFGVRPALKLNLESVIFESNTFNLKPSHTHSFSYSVGTGTESNTVTATCTDGCTDNYNTTGIKLTLSAPETPIYDGSAKTASLSGYPQTTVDNLAAQPTIQYFKTNEQGSTTASGDAIESAINAGYYVAQITWGGREVKVPFTIAKAAGSISFSSASETKSIGAENFTKTVTNTGDGTVNYSSDKATVATVDGTSGEVTIVGAGEAIITATVVDGTNYSYETKTASYTLTVNKADVSVTAPTAVTGLTYNGNEQTLISAGSTEDGTIVYSLDGETYAETIPTGVNAGEYTVYYKVIGDKNHKDSEAATVSATIGKAAMENKTVTDEVEVISAGVTDETIDLKDYLFDGAKLEKAEKSGELADAITAGTLKDGIFIYSVAENDGGLTGTITLTVSSTNYKDYAIIISLVSAKKITEVVVESKDVEETAVETVQVPALTDFTEAQPETTVEVKMEVKLESEDTVAQELGAAKLNKIKETIAEAFGGVANTELKQEYLDITVTKSVNGGAAQSVPDVNRVLEIEVGYDLTGKYNPVVVREHEGTVTQFTRLSSRPTAAGSYKDGTYYVEGSGNTAKLYIYGRLFSVYTVAYTTTASYQVTFDDATGNTAKGTESNVTQVVVATGAKVVKPADPKLDGYDFDGWFISGTDTKWNFDTAVTSDITLVAHWSEEDDDDDDDKDIGVAAPVVATTPRSPKTNDGLMGYAFWMMLAAAGICVTVGNAKGRKKEQE